MTTNKPVTRRFLLPAIYLAAFLFFFVNLYSHQWSSLSISGSTAPTHVPSPIVEQEARLILQPLSPPQDSSLPTVADAEKFTDSPALECSVIKLSMLYGAHRFPQLFDAVDSHRKHSHRWGCSFENLEHELTDRPHFSKQYFILLHMLRELAKPADQRKEWIMWVDADSIVINPAVSPEAFLPPANLDKVWAVVTADGNGLNDGVFYLRVHHSSVDLLTETIDYNFAHPEEDLGWLGEQIAMGRVIEKRETAARKAGTPTGIAWIPRLWFNSFQTDSGYEGGPGHHIVHFAGLGDTRLGLMEQWLTELKADQAKWEVPFAETFYQQAIPKFWDDYAVSLSKEGP